MMVNGAVQRSESCSQGVMIARGAENEQQFVELFCLDFGGRSWDLAGSTLVESVIFRRLSLGLDAGHK